MVERRKYKRLEVPLPLRMKLLGMAEYGRGIKMITRNVSLDGLLIETQIFLENDILLIQKGEESVKLDSFLVSNGNPIELDIKVPPDGKMVRATVRVKWYYLGSRGESYYFRTGISLEKMGVEDEKRWANFIRTTA